MVYRDVAYDGFRLVVELDGRIRHEYNKDKWDDQDRDLGRPATPVWAGMRGGSALHVRLTDRPESRLDRGVLSPMTETHEEPR